VSRDTGADWVHEHLAAHADELVAFRRHLHAHPELSHHEVLTTELIAERLRIAGLEPRVLSSGTGLVCDIGPARGPRVVLRADIDALAMDDTTSAPYRSTVQGVAHGCGHDLHTTVVLGAGLALAQHGVGGVRLVFEPAEESVPGGAVTVIADGALDDAAVIYGFHADPKLDVGTVGIRPGPLTAAADIVEIELHGPGGHTARPELTVDLVAEAARIATALPGLVASAGSGTDDRDRDHLHLVIGALQAGDAANVIPTTALLRGSVRTSDVQRWRSAEQVVCAALDSLVDDPRLRATCRYQQGVPPVVNDPDVAARATQVATRVLGAERVVVPPRSLGGDSFAWYLERVPGCYVRLGVHRPEAGEQRLDLHSGAFDVDDRAIAVGIEVMVALVLDHLPDTTATG
jgi:amidohydrolase